MPANLTPAYLAAEARFRAAKTNEEKVAALDEMYATIPKHKGTEKMRADIKRRMSKLRARGDSKSTAAAYTEREGVGRIALVGLTGAGKTSIFAQLSGEKLDSKVGFMRYDGVEVQIVDVAVEDIQTGVADWVINADAVAVVLDLGDDMLLDQLEDIRTVFSQAGVNLSGRFSVDTASRRKGSAKPSLIIGAKLDVPNARENLEALKDAYGDEFEVISVSAITGEGIEGLAARLHALLAG